MIPYPAQHPFTRLEFPDEGLDPAGELGRGIGVAQIHRGKLEAAGEEMDVIVHESGSDEPARDTDLPGVGAALRRDRGAVAHREYGVAPDGDSPCPGIGAVAGPDPSEDEQVGPGSGGTGEDQRENEDQAKSWHGGSYRLPPSRASATDESAGHLFHRPIPGATAPGRR